jgi:hypothetical protein
MYHCLFTGIDKLVTWKEIFKLDILQIISQYGGQVQTTSPEGGGVLFLADNMTSILLNFICVKYSNTKWISVAVFCLKSFFFQFLEH